MKKTKKYILVLLLLLLAIGWYVFDKVLYEENTGTLSCEYSFENKKTSEVLEDCRDFYNEIIDDESDLESNMKVLALIDYLLYKNKIDIEVYYDVLKSLSVVKKDVDDERMYELSNFMNKKRKTGICYKSIVILEPELEDETHAFSIMIRKSNIYDEYIKCRFVKEGGKWKYTDFENLDNVRIVGS